MEVVAGELKGAVGGETRGYKACLHEKFAFRAELGMVTLLTPADEDVAIPFAAWVR